MNTLQTEIAATAAALVVEEGLEYGQAKRRAVKQMALPQRTELPGNDLIEDAVLEYIARLNEETREAPDVVLGTSVRAGLALSRAAKVRALASGRDYVVPDDVKRLAVVVLAHRMVLDPEEEFRGATPAGKGRAPLRGARGGVRDANPHRDR